MDETDKKRIINSFIQIPGITHILAKKLYEAGYRSYSDILKSDDNELKTLLGFDDKSVKEMKKYVEMVDSEILGDLLELEDLLIKEKTERIGIPDVVVEDLTLPDEKIQTEADMPSNGYNLQTTVSQNTYSQTTIEARDKKIIGRRYRKYFIVLICTIVVAVIILSTMLFMFNKEEQNLIKIDGDFTDWDSVPKYTKKASPVDDNIDITEYRVHLGNDLLSFMISVKGSALAGEPYMIPKGDSFQIFIDVDRNKDTGYKLNELGAEYMLRIIGRNKTIDKSILYKYDIINDSTGLDWNSWKSFSEVPAIVSGSNIETQVRLSTINIDDKTDMDYYIHSLSWCGQEDYADCKISNTPGVLIIDQTSINNYYVPADNNVKLLFIGMNAINSDMKIKKMTFSVKGNTDINDISLNIGNKGIISGSSVIFTFDPPLIVYNGDDWNCSLYADLTSSSSASLVGISLVSVDIEKGAVSIKSHLENYMKYIDKASGKIYIDGAFGDWDRTTLVANQNGISDSNIDIDSVGVNVSQNDLSLYLRVNGGMMAGTIVPTKNGVLVLPQHGPGKIPKLIGEDFSYVFIDSDNSTTTGYAVAGIGADFLVNVTGKNGCILNKKMFQFIGKSKNQYAWQELTQSVDAEKDTKQMEIGIDITGLVIQPDYRIVFITKNWKGDWDSEIISGESYIMGFGSSTLLLATTLTAAPTIDGNWGSTEWAGADSFISSNYNIHIGTKGFWLFICIRVKTDTLTNNNDYCEVFFERDHGGQSTIDSADRMFRITGTVSGGSLEDYDGTGGTWNPAYSSANANKGAAAKDPDVSDGNYITYEFKIHFDEVWGTKTPSAGQIAGFGMHVYDADSSNQYYWGSGSVNTLNPSTWGDLRIPEFVFAPILIFFILLSQVKSRHRKKK